MRLILPILLSLLLGACATAREEPYGIWEGGMRGPDNEACSVHPNDDGTTDLLPCNRERDNGERR